jgi:hypothetical protein
VSAFSGHVARPHHIILFVLTRLASEVSVQDKQDAVEVLDILLKLCCDATIRVLNIAWSCAHVSLADVNYCLFYRNGSRHRLARHSKPFWGTHAPLSCKRLIARGAPRSQLCRQLKPMLYRVATKVWKLRELVLGLVLLHLQTTFPLTAATRMTWSRNCRSSFETLSCCLLHLP